jgi:3-phosphoshikimate 1-carboxyvinyltransferase
MADYHIQPSHLHGGITVPPSKSHTLRAILFAALAKGTSTIHHFLPSPDTSAMIDAVRLLGAEVTIKNHTLLIQGVAGKPHVTEDIIQCGNSGQVLRFIGAIGALSSHYTVLTGDHSIRHQRPVKPLLEGLTQLGAFATSTRGDDYAPIIIKGPLTKRTATLEGKDSQPVSGLLIAAAFAPHPIELHVKDPGEKPWIDLTLDWFQRLGINYHMKDYTFYKMQGSSQLESFTYTVPGDFSTAAFPIAAALLTHSEVTLYNVDMKDIQGDKAIIPILERMGAIFNIDPDKRTLSVKKQSSIEGGVIDVNDCIDALPILSVIACFAKKPTNIVNAAIARKKESDRIACMASELKKMGAKLEEMDDGLTIYPSKLYGAEVNSYHDHRIALSLSVAALAAIGVTTVHGVECMAKTYPNFYDDFKAIGANIRL